MIYTQFGLPVTIIHAEWAEKAPLVPGWILTCEHTGSSNTVKRFRRYAFELKADGGLTEIDAAAKVAHSPFPVGCGRKSEIVNRKS